MFLIKRTGCESKQFYHTIYLNLLSVNVISKLPNAGTTIFTVMSALAAEYKAVNLGQGFPDFPMDQELARLVNDAVNQNYK